MRSPHHARHCSIARVSLGTALQPIHALRRRVLLRAVEALIHGRRLTLMDLAHSRPDAERVRALSKRDGGS